jgi:uracil-DNA glycosylase
MHKREKKMENIHPIDQSHTSWQPLFEQYSFDLDTLYTSAHLCPSKQIYPPKECVFKVFELDLQKIQVVLLGQDPYHSPGQAHGLSFSVPSDQKIPPSLRNIFKELNACFPERNYEFKNGNLERWFKEEGIFLLNCSLTVEDGKPGSHMKIWEDFTNDVIQYISKKNPNCVFLLLGKFAQSKMQWISNQTNIVCAPHPSPLARGFCGSNCFIQVESILGHQVVWEL